MARVKTKSNARNKNNSRKPNTRGRGRDRMDKEENLDVKKSSNDPSWYATNDAILRDAASYPFSYNTGATEIHLSGMWQGSTDIDTSPSAQVPGICSLHVYPCVGTALDATDPINVAAASIYSFIRHANSGHSNYFAPDMMIYIIAMAQMYQYLVWCERLYGYAMTYDQRNRYLPDELIRTNNVDAQDLRNNLANFRFWINTLIAKLASFAVPASMTIFNRMSFMYSDCYIEGTSIKEQVYQFVPEGFYKFKLDADQAGMLEWTAFDYSTLMSTQDVITYGDALFQAIWDQEDFGIMSGDILKAYGDNIIKIPEVPELYTIYPKFDPMVLTQMKNADIVRIDPANITQSPTYGIVLQALVPLGFTTADEYIDGSTISSAMATVMNRVMVLQLKDYHILTVDTDDPTPAVVMEATRLKVAYDAYKGWYKVGTELITKVALTAKPGTDMVVTPYNLSYYDNAGTCTPIFEHMVSISRHFHYMPAIWLFSQKYGTSKFGVETFFDVDNFTILTYEDVRKLHEAATINMFAVPAVGKVM